MSPFVETALLDFKGQLLILVSNSAILHGCIYIFVILTLLHQAKKKDIIAEVKEHQLLEKEEELKSLEIDYKKKLLKEKRLKRTT